MIFKCITCIAINPHIQVANLLNIIVDTVENG